MSACAVICCKSYYRKTKGTDIKYFSFPRDENLAKVWISACRRVDKIDWKSARICSLHFNSTDFEVPLIQQMLSYSPRRSRNLKSHAIPTVNMPDSTLDSLDCRKRKINDERWHRLEKSETQEHSISSTENNFIVPHTTTASADMDISELDILKKEISILEKNNYELCTQIQELQQENDEIQTLKKKCENLSRENQCLEVQKLELDTLLAKVFTPGQIKMLKSGKEITYEMDSGQYCRCYLIKKC